MGDKDTYIRWLNEAYAREMRLVSALEGHIAAASGLHELRETLKFRLERARGHAYLIRSCLDRLLYAQTTLKAPGVDLERDLKAAAADKTAAEHAGDGSLVGNTIDDLVATHKGIAAYSSLLIAAGSMRDAETARICRQILVEEEHAATLIGRHLPVVTHLAMKDGVHTPAAL